MVVQRLLGLRRAALTFTVARGLGLEANDAVVLIGLFCWRNLGVADVVIWPRSDAGIATSPFFCDRNTAASLAFGKGFVFCGFFTLRRAGPIFAITGDGAFLPWAGRAGEDAAVCLRAGPIFATTGERAGFGDVGSGANGVFMCFGGGVPGMACEAGTFIGLICASADLS